MFTAANYFRISHYVLAEAELTSLLDRGEVRAVLQIPAGFGRDIPSDRTASFQLITDGTDSNSTAIVLGYAGLIVSDYSDRIQMERLARKGITTPPVQIETVSRAWFNANQESRFYYVPSLIATMLFIFSLLLTSIGIVREKEIGTIEQVMVTPIRGFEFILGKTIPYMITGYISMTIMLIVAFLVFGVHVRGSLPLLYLPDRHLSRRQYGHRPDHQRQRRHPAAGPAHQLPGADALGHAQRFHVPDQQHARAGPLRHRSSTRCAGISRSCAASS